jgi:hypothetical protein
MVNQSVGVTNVSAYGQTPDQMVNEMFLLPRQRDLPGSLLSSVEDSL